MTASVNRKGKLQFLSPNRISLCSTGSGAVLKHLLKGGPNNLRQLLKDNGVEVVQFLGTRDLEAGIADIGTLGYLLDSNNSVDLAIAASRNNSGFIPDEPSVLRDAEGKIVIQSPEIVERIAFEQNLLPEIYTNNCNMYITLEKLNSVLEDMLCRSKVLMYSRKFRDLNLFNYDAILSVSDLQNADPCNSFSFEINLFNLASVVQNPKIIIRDHPDPILLKKNYKTNSFNIPEVKSKVMQSIK